MLSLALDISLADWLADIPDDKPIRLAGDPHVDAPARQVSVPVAAGDGVLTRAVRELDTAGIAVDDAGVRRPTLDDVFLVLTGQHPDAEVQAEADATARQREEVRA